MPRHVIDVGSGVSPLLDIGSYARRGPARRDRLSPTQIEHIARTVHHVPEVMVKVLSRGGQDLKAVTRHLSYLGRTGELDIETDDGQRLKGKGVEKKLLDDWDLDLDQERHTVDLKPRSTRRPPPRLVHKLMFSMPPGTPPEKVLAAVKNFAREEFGAKHRYAMVLHIDEPHPHVHMVVKAMGEDGLRLNIRKDTLRSWRREFARHLRDLGVPANATDRAARGATRPQKSDGIHRAAMRAASTHYRRRAETALQELREGKAKSEPGKARLLATRHAVLRGWEDLSEQLKNQGHQALAADVRTFAARMPPPLTDNEMLKTALRDTLEKSRARSREDRER